MTLNDGAVTVDVPAGAVTADVTLTAAVATNAPASDLAVTGGAVDLGPAGTTFASPVTITLTYEEASLPAGVDESELRLFRAVDDSCELLDPSSVNATDNTVSGATSSFSIFGILGLEVDAVSISPSAATISLGGSQQFTAVAKSGSTDLPNRPIVWSTADPAVATVDAAGLV